jgi:hypothetical protein
LGSRAVELLKVVVDVQHVPADQTLKRCVMSAYLAGVLAHALRKG